MIKIEYSHLDSIERISDLYILLDDEGYNDQQIGAMGDELLTAGITETDKAIYKMVGSDVFVAYKNNLIEVIDQR